MQLDQTHVTIRARTLTEISDLAMVMIRSYPTAIIIGFAMGALPWAILNALLLGMIPINEFQVGTFDEDMYSSLAAYQILMAMLVFVQTPAAGVFTTIYIGRAIFESGTTWRTVIREAKTLFPRWFWALGILRGPVPLMLFVLLFWGRDYSYEIDYGWPISIAMVVMMIRSCRPFLPEIILLERCPLTTKKQSPVITAGRRSSALHRPITGELLGRFIAMTILLIAMTMLGFYSLLWVRGILFGMWEWDAVVYLILYPLALWASASLSVLIRFLSYLDTRIRLEGWEVQLAVLAESIRQFGDRDKPVVEAKPLVQSARVLEG